ncbi:hypothetical protein SISSUDRAFT_1066016 [Sistotremastrum suecicum HHB10207 ss-3]|uniref:N-acetyltransferase domain-containing protein n=1 Tax=Sistotremastrum suecicum HHB10207 ss-3 TaxID=1314776 RepID=A0A165YTF8_9AGAM|nr:hypothetical protein SISSUDRAFT_1066016 [Sistotremastrum suecicum HHB10207 ss-3]
MSATALTDAPITEKVTIRRISTSETLPLRSSVLWPGAPLWRIQVPDDDHPTTAHYGAFIPGVEDAIAIISLFIDDIPEGEPVDGPPKSTADVQGTDTQHGPPIASIPIARFRKFACDPSYQGQGVGTKLLKHVFDAARSDMGAKTIWCSARVETQPWYEKRGMRAFGDTWLKADLLYVKMRIDLKSLN